MDIIVIVHVFEVNVWSTSCDTGLAERSLSSNTDQVWSWKIGYLRDDNHVLCDK